MNNGGHDDYDYCVYVLFLINVIITELVLQTVLIWLQYYYQFDHYISIMKKMDFALTPSLIQQKINPTPKWL